MDETGWEQLMPRPKARGRAVSPLTSHQFALTTVAAPAVVWAALTDGDLTRCYLHGLAALSIWSPGAPLTLRSGSGPGTPPAAGQLTGQVVRAEPPRQLSYLLRSGPHDPATFLTWLLRATPGGTTVRLQIDEFEGSSDDDAEDTWLPVLAALHALLDSGPSRTEPATGEQSGPSSAAPIVLSLNQRGRLDSDPHRAAVSGPWQLHLLAGSPDPLENARSRGHLAAADSSRHTAAHRVGFSGADRKRNRAIGTPGATPRSSAV
jgi:uncharacterized protein YndB with AHSA1/START domain